MTVRLEHDYDRHDLGPMLRKAVRVLAGSNDGAVDLYHRVAVACGGFICQGSALALIEAAETVTR